MSQIRTQLVELVEQGAVVTKNCQRDSEAAHNAEVRFFRLILEEGLQHAEGEYQRSQGHGDAQYER